MWIAVVVIAAIAAGAVIWAAWSRKAAGGGTKQSDVPWREPGDAKEIFVLFAAVAEAATVSDASSAWITVDWSWGRDRDDAAELCFCCAGDLSSCAGTPAGRYLTDLMDAQHRVRRDFRFAVASGGVPRCFRSGNKALAFIRGFAPHAYVDEEYANHFCVRFREHSASDLPRDYRGRDGLTRVIVEHYNPL